MNYDITYFEVIGYNDGKEIKLIYISICYIIKMLGVLKN